MSPRSYRVRPRRRRSSASIRIFKESMFKDAEASSVQPDLSLSVAARTHMQLTARLSVTPPSITLIGSAEWTHHNLSKPQRSATVFLMPCLLDLSKEVFRRAAMCCGSECNYAPDIDVRAALNLALLVAPGAFSNSRSIVAYCLFYPRRTEARYQEVPAYNIGSKSDISICDILHNRRTLRPPRRNGWAKCLDPLVPITSDVEDTFYGVSRDGGVTPPARPRSVQIFPRFSVDPRSITADCGPPTMWETGRGTSMEPVF
ncbi:hypothetical protein EVAR_56910_1 [Eumeta japonica]|uniref:Uncharacterized protein n=1 Tax=Eumeta variegata TaxID=151549 RepID=A0A4C1YEL4_EUMVA|nr:hypothetical protein EVAR_56910_1 [Eumeta japonica]